MPVPVGTPDGPFYYPDVVVACGEEPEDPYVEDAPCFLVEVLAPNTESTDRREKLIAYRRLPGLRAYLIVAQNERVVERHFREEGGRWQTAFIEEGCLPVPCPPDRVPKGAGLSLEGIYAGL